MHAAGVAIILDAMKTLLLLHHAKSSWKHSELADHDRPLNKRGKRTAPLMGALLQDEDLIPDLICFIRRQIKNGFSGLVDGEAVQ